MLADDFIDVSFLAKMLQGAFENESCASQAALAWSVRNRLEAGASLAQVVSALYATGHDVNSHTCSQRLEILASAGIIAQVFGDKRADPTSGATHFHRHDVHPAWAGEATPCALIGSYFYYTDDAVS